MQVNNFFYYASRSRFAVLGICGAFFSIIDFHSLYYFFHQTSAISGLSHSRTWFTYPSGFRNFLFVAFTSMAMMPIAAKCTIKNTTSPLSKFFNTRYSGIIFYSSLILVSISLFYLELKTGNRQFDGWDLSGIVDVGWRQILGQKPYFDFICVLPAGFILAIKYAFLIFGVAWNSMTILNCCFLIGSLWWLYFLFRKYGISRIESLLLSLVAEMMSVFMISYWWYNSATSILGCIYFLSAITLIENKSRYFGIFSYVLSLSLLALFKPNSAMMLIFGVSCVMCFSKVGFFKIGICSIIAFFIDYVVLHVNGLSPLIVCRGYLEATSRVFPTKFFSGFIFPEKITQAYEFFLAGIPIALLLKNHSQRSGRLHEFFTKKRILCTIAISTGLYQCGTSRELLSVALPLIFIPALIMFDSFIYQSPWAPAVVKENSISTNSHSNDSVIIRTTIRATLLFFIVIGIAFGILRYRIQLVDPFFETTSRQTNGTIPFFHSCSESPSLIETLEEISTVVHENPTASFFLGPRLEFAYCSFNLVSPLKMPLWWDKGSTYKAGNEPEIIANWGKRSFDIAIMKKDDFFRLPKEIRTILEDSYWKKPLNQITVYRKKYPCLPIVN
jgi:hypothetical protein